jgi:hypothetical protein
MRFRADGPSIPDELLEQRDRGNVVFFCGAGISKPAGLPGFAELAKRVMKALGTDVGAKSRLLLDQGDGAQNTDRVFTCFIRNTNERKWTRRSIGFSRLREVPIHRPTQRSCGCREGPRADHEW